MFKKLVLAAFIAAAVFAKRDNTAGGYSPVDISNLQNLQNDEIFAKAETLAEQAFQSQYNEPLGKLVALSEQVVAGVNYKMTYETPSGEYEIIVFCQPWTNTYEVTSIKPISSIQ